MTTIIGIKAYGGTDHSVVMAADLQATLEGYKAGPDAIYKVQKKETFEKLMVDDEREIVLAIAGTINTPPTNRFIRRLLHPHEGEKKIDMKKKLKKGYIPEFKKMNMENCKVVGCEKVLDDKQQCYALIGARFDEDPNLYYVFPMGQTSDSRIKDMDEEFYISIGSGSEPALNFLKGELKKVKSVNTKNAIELASQAIIEATETDIYSTGSDLAVITPKKIFEFGKQIREASEKAIREELDNIKDQF